MPGPSVGASTRFEHDWQVGRSADEVPCGDKTNLWQFAQASAPDDNCGSGPPHHFDLFFKFLHIPFILG